jgi:hypothetical protein
MDQEALLALDNVQRSRSAKYSGIIRLTWRSFCRMRDVDHCNHFMINNAPRSYSVNGPFIPVLSKVFILSSVAMLSRHPHNAIISLQPIKESR